MIEFETNTIAYMTAALEHACGRLREDSPAARAHIADRLEACARGGGESMVAFSDAAAGAIEELNRRGETPAAPGLWQRLVRWSFARG